MTANTASAERWIVAKANGAGLGFTETKYFGESCEDVSPDEVEIGWMLRLAAWGRGYATEAGSAFRDEAFDRLELESIVAVHHPSARTARDSGRAARYREDVTAHAARVSMMALPPGPVGVL